MNLPPQSRFTANQNAEPPLSPPDDPDGELAESRRRAREERQIDAYDDGEIDRYGVPIRRYDQ